MPTILRRKWGNLGELHAYWGQCYKCHILKTPEKPSQASQQNQMARISMKEYFFATRQHTIQLQLQRPSKV